MSLKERFSMVVFLSVSLNFAAVSFVVNPKLEKNGSEWKAVFELNEYADVEVAIVDTSLKIIVCHLAAGRLGPNAPAPLTSNKLHQELVWDGKDDYRITVQNTENLSVRVRVGLSAKLDKIVGGDPYAFFSKEMNRGDHTIWSIAGLEGKSDGSVYVYGTSNQMGVYTVRKYDTDGNYLKTVFPFPSGIASDKVKGWGVNTKRDGTYSPLVPWDEDFPVYTNTPLNDMHGFGPQPILIPNKNTDKLIVASAWDLRQFRFNTDGSIGADTSYGPITNNPKITGSAYTKVYGALFKSYTPDSASFYLSGMCRVDTAFWREGQIWKVDTVTRKPVLWFSLSASLTTNPANSLNNSYSAIHGTAVDDSHHVFVCNRVQNRILVLDSNANIIRSITLANPDAVEIDKSTDALYVTTRYGTASSPGNVKLHKFKNWRTDTQPVTSIDLCKLDMEKMGRDRTYILIKGTGSSKRIWVAFKDLAVRIYRESADTLELVKDFYESGKKQRGLGFNRMVIDPGTENVYAASGLLEVYKLTDWNNPVFVKCSMDVTVPSSFSYKTVYGLDSRQLASPDISIDHKGRYLYASMHPNSEVVYRFSLDGQNLKLAPLGSTGSAKVSDTLLTNESPPCLYRDRGIYPGPDGGVAAVSGWGRPDGNDYANVHLQYHYVDPVSGLASKFDLDSLGARTGGVRMDLKGNIYAGARIGPAWSTIDSVPEGFKNDLGYAINIGKIFKYTPTGSFESGKLYTNTKIKPAKIYNIGYGRLPDDANGINPRFGLDNYGRIYYPNTLTQTVAVMDNEGNELLKFGTYGNLDEWLSAQSNPDGAIAIPLSWPNSVDVTEDYIYVADYINSGIVRMKKNYVLDNMNGSSFGLVSKESVKVSKSEDRIFAICPNPFSVTSSISFNVDKNSRGSVKVYDMRGKLLRVLADGVLSQGFHSYKWNGALANGVKQAAGVYLVKLDVNGKNYQKRVIRF